jgi:hypothetical protein
MKSSSCGWVAIVAVVAVTTFAAEPQAPPDFRQVLKIQRVKSLETVVTNGVYHAFATVFFENHGKEAYRLPVGATATVFFEYKDNKEKVVVDTELVEETVGGKTQTIERMKYKWVYVEPVLLGPATLEKPLTFARAKGPGEPGLTTQKLDIIVGPDNENTRQRLLKIMNMLTNPSGTSYGVRLCVDAIVSAQRIEGEPFAGFAIPSRFELEKKPEYAATDLFK